MALGRGTHNLLDRPLAVSSVFTPFVGDQGYSFTGMNTIYVLHNVNGSLATYNEAAASDAFGTVTLAVPLEQDLTLDYNQSMIKRIQSTQIMDIPVDAYVKKWVAQQLDQVFVPAHDVYSLAKLAAARPVGNKIVAPVAGWTGSGTGATKLSYSIGAAITKVTDLGGDVNQMVGWVSTALLNSLKSEINFTGSDAGYNDAKNSHYLGKHDGVTMVSVPSTYFPANVYAIFADKRAIVNVKPKLDPKGNGYVLLEKVPGFSGVEVQLRDRGATFVLGEKARNVSTIEQV
jgi:hypothetical protein